MEKIFRYPWLIVLVVLIITVFFALNIPRLELDNNNFRFISENDPARIVLREIDDTFGSSVFILVAFHRKTGDVFDQEFLSRIRSYVEQIQEIKIVDRDNLTSIVNAEYITGDNEAIRVEKLLSPGFSGTQQEIAELKEKLLSWDIYKRALISDDFSSTQILVPLSVMAEEAGNPEVMDSFIFVRDIAREMFSDIADVYVTGIPVISATINESMRADLALLVPLVVVVVLAILFLSFRHLYGVVLPLLTVMIATVWSMGVNALFGVKLSVISTVLPVILVAVGSAYGIHVITRHMIDAANKIFDRQSYTESVIASVKIVVKPVFLASITTFAGFISFCFTTVLPIREFGIFASFGVMASFAIAVTFIPALLIIIGPPKKAIEFKVNNEQEYSGDFFSRLVARFFSAIAIHKYTVLIVTAVIFIVAVMGASRLIIDNVFVEYFKPNTDIAKSDRFIREQFGGGKIISIVAKAETSRELLHPASLGPMENLNRYLESTIKEVGKTNGFTDLIKRINQVFNADESPEGIKPAATYTYNDSDTFGSFGFGSDDDFGFGSFGDIREDDTLDQTPAETQNTASFFSQDDFVSLLGKAANSGSSINISAAELVNEVKKLVNYKGAAYYEIPVDPGKYGKTSQEDLATLVSNYLILLSGNISPYANDGLEPTAIKTTIQLRTIGEADTYRAVEAINNFVGDNFPENIEVIIGGSALVESSLNRQVVKSQIITLIMSLALVFIILAFSNKSITAGFVGLVSLSISILINFAVMGFLGIKLNLATSMIASLAIGIGIDYTIHYMEAFKREKFSLEITSLPAEKLRVFLARTFAVSGKAVIINALSVGAGFAVLLLSNFKMLGDFGLLIAVTMGVSSLVSLTLIPALILTFKPSYAFALNNKTNNTIKGEAP